ncbi:hypothetical protein IMZ48_26835 [Candidatus Bathyarchaeota archaeon]|nr:hypothetical protein [Candidatus Bathyarchaeota archaeon]
MFEVFYGVTEESELQEAETGLDEMRKSWDERQEVWDQGGEGYWSKGDVSKIVWEIF